MMKYIYILFISNFLLSQMAWYNHPELEWKTIETENFKIHYHQGTENSAKEAAAVAEYIYPNVTSLYDYYPDEKTEIIIKDVDDYSNGSAYYYYNTIEIWAKPMDYDLRGSHRWMNDVITHEFTHIVQLGKSMKFSNHFPGSYFQMIGYEDEKRDDVIYGYPNQIISYTLPNTAVPPWFAEGTAQYMYESAYFDYWDSIRDMLLRDKVINSSLLTFNEMNTFGKCGLGNELVYNQGFSLVNYIAQNYGEESLKKISEKLANPLQYSINEAIDKSIGISGHQLYDLWKESLINNYNNQINNQIEINNYDKNYHIIESDGISNLNPIWSPDGYKIAFISNKENDYFSQTDLFIYNIIDSTSLRVAKGVKSKVAWIDDNTLIYTKRSKPDNNGSKFFDLYLLDVEEEEENRLTEGMRLFSPIYDSNTEKIYAINTFDGTNNIIISNKDCTEFENLTNFKNGMQIFTISKSSLQKNKIIIDANITGSRQLYIIDLITKEIDEYLHDNYEKRDPCFSKIGELYYSSDKNGIYNLYKLSNDKNTCVTNVKGGIFDSNVSINGEIAFSVYDNGRYSIGILNESQNIDVNSIIYSSRPSSAQIESRPVNEAVDYSGTMKGPFILPRIMVDYNTIKPGFYFYDIETLNSLSIMGAFSYNSRKDLDFALMFDYNKNRLTHYFNFYWATRHTSRIHQYNRQNGLVLDNLTYDADYTYHLFSSDIGSRFIIKDHKFKFYYTFSSYRQFYDIIQTQQLPEEYLNDFIGDYETNYIVFDDAYDYFRGHSFTLDYELDAIKRHYLYSMLPNSGFKLNISVSFEKNRLFDEYKVNEDYGGFIPNLASHNTWRYKIDASKFWKISLKEKKYISIENNLLFNSLSNKSVDDFLYFFGGGDNGISGYTFYEPILQGTELFIITNKFRYPILSQESHGFSSFYVNSVSLGFIHQIGKTSGGKIIVNNLGYDINQIPEELWNTNIENYLMIQSEFDALDSDNFIDDDLEPYLYPDIYALHNDNNFVNDENLNISNLKKKYRDLKQSIGLEFRLLGFSFYSYPTALTYEYHIPIKDNFNSKGRQYLKLLFDF